jgi:hypothetical protein
VVKQRLLETSPEQVPADLVATVKAFSEPIEVIRSSYVAIVEVTEDFAYPRQQLAVAFELTEPSAQTEEGDRELRLVADRFYESMPEDVQAGGCNILEPGALAAWREKGQQVFSR